MLTVTAEDRNWYRDSGLTLMAYTSTARGYFADGARDTAGTFDSVVSQARRERARILAREIGSTADIIALAWLINQLFPVIPVLGTQNADHLAAALTGAEVILSAAQVHWLEQGD